MNRNVLTALAAAASLHATLPAQAAATPEQARALEAQLKAWMSGLLGPGVPVSDRLVQLTPDGDKYKVAIPIPVTRDNKPDTLQITASARPIENGRWNVDNVRLPLPARFTVMMPQPPKEGQKNAPPPTPVTYNVTADSQDGSAVWDPAFATPSTFNSSIAGLRAIASGTGLQQTTTVAKSTAATTLRPSGTDRVDMLADSTVEGYSLASKTADAEEVKVSVARGRITSGLTSLSRERATQVMQAFIRIGTSAGAAPKPGDKVPAAAKPPMDMAALRTLLQAMDGLATEYTLDETLDTVGVSYGPYAGQASQVSIGLGAKSNEGLLQGHMDFGMDGLALPDLPLGPMADLIPKRVALRPVFSGIATKDLLDMARASTETKDGNPPPASIAKLFSRGGITTGLESFLLDIGGTVFTGNAAVLVPSPDRVSGTGQITAANFDALVAKTNTIPQLAQVAPVFTFAKGLGRTVGDKLVWDVSYRDGKVVVNGTDLSAMMGGGHK